jgi:copper transport protein
MTCSRTLIRLSLALAVLLSPVSAWAHARLLRSDPAAKSRVSSPQLIVLWFSEQPEIALSVATLKDQNGKAFTVGAAQANGGNPLQISFAIPQTLPPGTYTVAWRTAASDGHPSHGTFSFVVVAASPVTTSQSSTVSSIPVGVPAVRPDTLPTADTTAQADEAASPLNSLVRAFSFAGIFLVVGVTVFNLLVVSRCSRFGSELVGKMESRAAVVGIAASLIVILGAFARLKLESTMMARMSDMHAMSMADMAMHTRWGFALRLEIISAVLALISFAIGIKRVRGAWLLASVWAVVLAFTPALAGHAAASPRLLWLMIATDFLHVLGGASWLGNLFCVMLIGVPLALALEKPLRWESVASLINAFSPVALLSVTVVVVSGVVASWVHLERVSALWSTSYGRVLLLKLALVLITLMIGAYNFRTVQPQLVSEEGTVRLRRTTVVELGFGALILVVTGFLTGIAP